MIKLKALRPRLYNVMFHTHTVSGIVISFALFVIFYAGAFSLFRDDLYRWENPLARFETQKKLDFDKTIQLLENKVTNLNDLKSISIVPPSSVNPFAKIFISYNKSVENKKRASYFVNPYTNEFYEDANQFNNPKSLTHMADTIYRLHYFRQIPVVGAYLAGLVGFFLIFAMLTGILIHWKNITNKFYDFRTKGKWKNIWTNTHTVLGTITIPFQLIYGITGALLGISILFLAPSASLLFDGDRDEIVKLVRPNRTKKYDEKSKQVSSTTTLNHIYDEVLLKYPNHHIDIVRINNLGKEDGTMLFQIDDTNSVAGKGSLLYKYKNGELIKEVAPNDNSYTTSVYSILIKLHFVNFGGYFLKIIYFILTMLTCYVMTSGVMIWKKARETSKYKDKQKRFHHRVTKLYLALTLSLFPAIALIFIANKIFPITMEFRVVYVKRVFFIGWLLFTIVGLFWNNYAKLQKRYLLIGSILALLIPVFNGVVTGDWFWKTFVNSQYYVFSVDFSWFLAGIFGLIIYKNLNLTKTIITQEQA